MKKSEPWMVINVWQFRKLFVIIDTDSLCHWLLVITVSIYKMIFILNTVVLSSGALLQWVDVNPQKRLWWVTALSSSLTPKTSPIIRPNVPGEVNHSHINRLNISRRCDPEVCRAKVFSPIRSQAEMWRMTVICHETRSLTIVGVQNFFFFFYLTPARALTKDNWAIRYSVWQRYTSAPAPSDFNGPLCMAKRERGTKWLFLKSEVPKI